MTLRCMNISNLPSARREDTKLPAQLVAPRMAKPEEATGKEDTKEEIIDDVILQALVPFIPAMFYSNYNNHVTRQLVLSPPVVYKFKDRINGSFLILWDVLLGLMHGEGASKWAVTAYKDVIFISLIWWPSMEFTV
ncbi:hypothetical protein DSO57_1035690 [Entomophthora muscae]|uniref:Uncharacterized protein n=1 Tax=Entomophthora muscae TaxID=34485 RepID=A0ACC2RE82_9FUNG|nr:hypothetical protein DSO57_1035690 [Entomophthora muscae]